MSLVDQDWMVGEAPLAPRARGTKVAIAGAGLITALGKTAEETWSNLMHGRSISDHAMVLKQWAGKCRVTGLALDAARAALAEARWTDQQIESAGLVVGTSKGAIVDWINTGQCGAGVGDVAFEVAGELRLNAGPRITVSTACASGLLALIRGALMIKSGEASRVLVVAAEASVHELFLSSFRRLGVLAKTPDGCRPFDEMRNGFLMSEAGAAICLESAGDGEGDQLLIEKMAMGGDATHLISGDEQARTLRALLDDVIDGRPVDLVHAHGTGTVQNDAIELGAIEDCVAAVRHTRPALYSHKGALGHSLGAAGLISAVINRMCHQRQEIPPGLGRSFMAMRHVQMSHCAAKRTVRRSIAIAAGFGGAMGVMSFVSG